MGKAVNDFGFLLKAAREWSGECYVVEPTNDGYSFQSLSTMNIETSYGNVDALEELFGVLCAVNRVFGIVARKKETRWEIYTTHGSYLIREEIYVPR